MSPTGWRRVALVSQAAGLLFAWCCFPAEAQSAQILTTSVTQQEERYILHAETLIQAPASKVRALLLDYENLPRINRDLKRVNILERLADGRVRMRVSSDICLLALCLNFVWIQDVRPSPNGDILMDIVPNHGDFRQGNGRWRVLPGGDGTRLVFDVDLTPKFWFPPLFGPWLMQRKLSEESFQTAQNLERMTDPM